MTLEQLGPFTMRLPSFGSEVWLHLSPANSEYGHAISDAGYVVKQMDWALECMVPDVLVTDAPLVSLACPTGSTIDAAKLADHLRTQLAQGTMGLLTLGKELADFPVPQSANLPADVSTSELLRSLNFLTRLVVAHRSLKQEQAERQRWATAALQDPLTLLPNRRGWDQELSQRLNGRSPICVGMIDVDNFKRINDHHGYTVGDTVLRETAIALTERVRNDEFVARLGGDEFGIIIQQVNQPVALQVIDQLREAVTRRLADKGLPVATLSAGIRALNPNEPRDSTAVFHAAANALQVAKSRARNLTVGHIVCR